MRTRPWVIGSRRSRLALAQAELVRKELKGLYPGESFKIKKITTTGDKRRDIALSRFGDKGIFTKEIEEALLKGEIDIAVHSMKDLPVELPRGLKIAAITKRQDPCDCLVSRGGFTLRSIPKGAKIGTSSLRRSAQLLRIRSDVQVLDLRGNLDTRIKKLERGLYDGIILAYAGIKRLGLDGLDPLAAALERGQRAGLNFSKIPIEEILPQAGQGSLGIEIRDSDQGADNLVKKLNDRDSQMCIDAERALLSGLGGGCQVPIGACANIGGGRIYLKAGVFSLDGKTVIRREITGGKKGFETLAKKLAVTMRKEGASEILGNV